MEWGEPEITDEFMEQRVSIIDSRTGIRWSGSARSVIGHDYELPVNKILDIVRNAVAEARRGVDGIRIYRYEQARIHVELRRNNGFLNASSIKMDVSIEDKNIYHISLDPEI